ncbi:3D domain-containing protein [Bacillus sp. FJAT-49736]|uniref:3D domain-containing protein n=1 Tax=Bacillus sp. FJAT-49736 TaxID=2833582 RepID=UPI001BCA17A4|nr:3D domain-containing protein [Bacillus sp. FJAT-49736]MBS4174964.1 LysM peptidoglycan-binding domain-containing protein [Bacillus sp. FJAT-49736]
MKKFILTLSTLLIITFGISNGAFAASNTYTVKKGDSLYIISKKYKISIAQLKQWNHLSSNTIHINQKLNISAPKSTVSTNAANAKASTSKVLTVTATAYTVNCKGCGGFTATGINLKKHPDAKVISVDPKVIPLGTKVYVDGYGYAIAADKGSSVKGNKIDVFYPTLKQAYKWGRKKVKVRIIK